MELTERLLKSIYRGAVLPLARSMDLRKRASSRGAVEKIAFEASNEREELLRQCRDALRGQPPLLQRHFHEFPSPPSIPSVRIVQWNILADALGTGGDNFMKCPQEALNWDTRKFRVLEELLTYDPDIMCLQEVDHYHDFFLPVLQLLGYHGTFMAKPSSPCLDHAYNNGPDGCALFFKKDKFDLMNCETLVLKVTNDGYQRWSNQVGIISTLRCATDNQSKYEIVVGVTHFKAKSGYHKLRHSQGLDLHEHFAKQLGSRHGVLVGDFNAEPTEEVYRLFAESSLNLNSAYKLLSAEGKTEPEYTTWKIRGNGEQCHTIDYMWYTRTNLAVKTLLRFPTGEEIGKNRLPSASYPSDHLSLVCDFNLLGP